MKIEVNMKMVEGGRENRKEFGRMSWFEAIYAFSFSFSSHSHMLFLILYNLSRICIPPLCLKRQYEATF